MKEKHINLPLGIGLLLFALAGILSQLTAISHRVTGLMMMVAIVFEGFGIARWAQSEAARNSPLRRWKVGAWRKVTAFARRRG